MIVGIDLGTTFSVVAVNGRVKLKSGYPEPLYLERCGVSIIPDPAGNYLVASAILEDPAQPGRLVVGAEARAAIDKGYTPVLFSKRDIGTNIRHFLGNREIRARDAARIILEYLKSMTEEALGCKVDRAVVTHPAYFDPAMKEETALAAQDAGFDFDPERHLLMEPIAAALAYTRTDAREPLRLLTYDLGGGTFDVTVMERKQGVTTIKAFGGNRLLGGFNFDRELAKWLLERLRARGVRVTIAEEDPTRRAKWMRLVRVAEQTKIKLAEARSDRVAVRIKEVDIFRDDFGKLITLQDEITRSQFVELIQSQLDETIAGDPRYCSTKGCNLTLAEAGFTIDQIDEILLVGGSTYGPWVAATIKKFWGREAQLFEPDLCVGAGAAIYASALPDVVEGQFCRLELDVPAESGSETIIVAGRVTSPHDDRVLVGARLELDSKLGRRATFLSDKGEFVFENVGLFPDSVTEFDLSVIDERGRSVLKHRFEVRHTQDLDSGETGILTVLPKPLFIEVLGGFKPLAREGEALPAQCEVDLFRTNEEDSIEIRLFQELELIGAVWIRDVPASAPIGSKVRVMVNVSRNNRITGRATVYDLRGQVVREAPVDIRIPPLQVPEREELRAEFESLEDERMQLVSLEQDAERRLELQAKGEMLSRRIRELLDTEDSNANRQEIWLLLRKLRQLIRAPRDEMEPSLAQFERTLARARELIAMYRGDPQIAEYAKVVDRLEQEGRGAYARKDRKAWKQINASLQNLVWRLETPARPGQVPAETPPVVWQKILAGMELDRVRQRLREREAELVQEDRIAKVQSRINRFREQIDELGTEIQAIPDSLNKEAALEKIQLLLFQKLKPIADQISALGFDVK